MSVVAKLLGLIGLANTPDQRSQKASKLAAHDKFKAAVREGDVAAMQELLRTQVSLSDELDRGRGLLQFAVMVNAVKAVRLLISMGADVTKKDSLGKSATDLIPKNASPALLGAMEGKTVAATV